MEGPQKPNMTIKVKFKGSKLATGSSKMPAAVVSAPFMRKLTALNKSMLEYTASSAYKKPKAAPSSSAGTNMKPDASDAVGRGKRRKVEPDASIPVSATTSIPLSSAHPNEEGPAPPQDQDGVLPMPFNGGDDEESSAATGNPRIGGLCLPASYVPAATASRFYTPQWTRKQHNKNIESIDPDEMVAACDYDLWLLLEAQKLFAPFSYKTHDMSVLSLQDTGSAEVLARWAVPPLTTSTEGTTTATSAASTDDRATASASASTSIAAEANGVGSSSGFGAYGTSVPPSSSGAGSSSSSSSFGPVATSSAVPLAPISVSWQQPSANGYMLPPPVASMSGYAPYASYAPYAPMPAPMAGPGYLPPTTYGAPQGYAYPMPAGYGAVMGYSGIPAAPSSSSGSGAGSWLPVAPSGTGGSGGLGNSSNGNGQLPPLLSLLGQSRSLQGSLAGTVNPQLLPTLWPSAHSQAPGARREDHMSIAAPSAPPPVVKEETSEIEDQIAQLDEELRAQVLENNRRIASLRRDALQTAPVRRELEDQQKQIERERSVLHRWRKSKTYIAPGSKSSGQAAGVAGNTANGATGKAKHVHRKKHGGY